MIVCVWCTQSLAEAKETPKPIDISRSVKMGKAKKGDGQDIHNRDGNPMNNKNGNLRSMSKSKNRSFARTRTARKKRA